MLSSLCCYRLKKQRGDNGIEFEAEISDQDYNAKWPSSLRHSLRHYDCDRGTCCAKVLACVKSTQRNKIRQVRDYCIFLKLIIATCAKAWRTSHCYGLVCSYPGWLLASIAFMLGVGIMGIQA